METTAQIIFILLVLCPIVVIIVGCIKYQLAVNKTIELLKDIVASPYDIQKINYLEDFVKQNNMATVIEHEKRKIIQAKIDEIGKDLYLTPAELEELKTLAIKINTSITTQEKEQLDKLISYTHVLEGHYHSIHSTYPLNRDEKLYNMAIVNLKELKHYKGRGYATPYDKLEYIDTGALLLTNRRILFCGETNKKIKFEKILGLRLFENNGLAINKGTSKPDIYMFDSTNATHKGDPILFLLLYNKLKEQFSSSDAQSNKYANQQQKKKQRYESSFRHEDTIALEFCYELLGLTPFALPEEVKKAYRTMAKKYHPDLGGDGHYFSVLTKARNAIMKNIKDKQGV